MDGLYPGCPGDTPLECELRKTFRKPFEKVWGASGVPLRGPHGFLGGKRRGTTHPQEWYSEQSVSM
eukprot:2665223-Pyramimonas_sp.AAC.1